MVAAVAVPPFPGRYRARLPEWSGPFLQPNRYKSARGGRGSGKSHTFAQAAVLRMSHLLPGYPNDPHDPVRFCCARQFQKSITDSVKQVIEQYIQTLGLADEYDRRAHYIRNRRTNAYMWFPGFSRNPQSLMGTEGMDVLWIEQAETIGDEMEKIVPTVRKPGSELWFSWNPITRTQWCWQRFVVKPRARDVSVHVNYYDNPWFTAELEDERLELLRNEPDRYEHVYLGHPDDADGSKVILPYALQWKCVKAYMKGLAPPKEAAPLCDFGFDIAEGGRDKCATVGRIGPTIDHFDMWPGQMGDLDPAARRAHDNTEGYDVYRMYYDGAQSMRGPLMRAQDLDGKTYAIRPVLFGGEVGGKDVIFERGRKNGEVFARRNIQMGMALRQRATRTVRLLNGDKEVDPIDCLFIRDDLPAREAFLAACSQPVRRRSPRTGKWEMDKRGEDGDGDSPDPFDAASLAFARDSDTGLRAW